MSDQESKGSDGKVRHGDAAMALFLAYHASLADPVHYNYIPVPRSQHHDSDRSGIKQNPFRR